MSMTPEEIFRRDAADWKKRAMVAEAKLANHRNLREAAELVSIAGAKSFVVIGSRLDGALVNLRDELGVLEEIGEAPKLDHFNQIVKVRSRGGSERLLQIRTVKNLGALATINYEEAVIAVDDASSTEAKLYGLMFQFLQLADYSAIILTGGDGSEKISADRMHQMVPNVLALLITSGLLTKDIRVTMESLDQDAINSDQTKD